jgi:hypothetical protein
MYWLGCLNYMLLNYQFLFHFAFISLDSCKEIEFNTTEDKEDQELNALFL